MNFFKVFDSHCHIDLLLTHEQQFPEKYLLFECGGLSWAFADQIRSWRDYPRYWQDLRAAVLRLRANGLPFYYLVGIHPRCIPGDLQDESSLPTLVDEALQEHMCDPLCRGLGELGLDSGSQDEYKVLGWQLKWSLSRLPKDKRIGIHTPRKNKMAVTKKILEFLSRYQDLKDRIVIDHLTPEIWDLLSQEPYMLGMTLQDGKASLGDLMTLLDQQPQLVSRLMLNSDAAVRLSEPYLDLIQGNLELLDQFQEMLLWRNAVSFFEIPL